MSKMFVLCGIVMLHVAVAARDKGWLSNSPHHSMEREQIAYEPSSDEIQEFQEVLQSVESPVSATKEQARVLILRMRNMEKYRNVEHWTEAKAFGLGAYARLFMPLNVSASAVSFCSELMKETKTRFVKTTVKDEDFLKSELRGAKDICPKVLTGSLKPADGKAKNWEVEAAKVSQIHGKEHEFGRLDKVAWRSSLQRVCTDECNALVDGMKNQARQLEYATLRMMNGRGSEGDSVEEVCADIVVKNVEAEILTCCATSCGWNGQICTYWPLMSPTEQDEWQGECCTEMNILQNSTREKLCDSTLTEHETEESKQIIDNRDNTPKDRAILGQDRGGSSNAWSFLEEHPIYDAGNCPSPLDLAKRHKKWATDWKRMDEYNLKGAKRDKCKRKPQDTIEGCKIFLINKKQTKYVYICLDACKFKFKAPDQKALEPLTTESALSFNEWVYVHKEIYMTNWTLT